MPLGPLRRFGPMTPLGEWPRGMRESEPILPVGDPFSLEEFYRDWLEEVQAHLYFPWAGDKRFGDGKEITLAASASLSEVVGFSLPPSHIGVWYTWAQNVGAVGDYANIRWRLSISGMLLDDHYSLIGQVSSLISPEWIYAPLPQGSRVAVLADNTTATAINTVGARIRGWHWPMKGRRG